MPYPLFEHPEEANSDLPEAFRASSRVPFPRKVEGTLEKNLRTYEWDANSIFCSVRVFLLAGIVVLVCGVIDIQVKSRNHQTLYLMTK